MSTYEVRPFQRADREQVTQLVKAHTAAVMPGVAASVNMVLSQFEHEPGEFAVRDWAPGCSGTPRNGCGSATSTACCTTPVRKRSMRSRLWNGTASSKSPEPVGAGNARSDIDPQSGRDNKTPTANALSRAVGRKPVWWAAKARRSAHSAAIKDVGFPSP
jgi:hypothetical protein